MTLKWRARTINGENPWTLTMLDILSQLSPIALGATGGGSALVTWLYLLVRRQRKALDKIQEITNSAIHDEDKVAQIKIVLVWAKTDPTVPQK